VCFVVINFCNISRTLCKQITETFNVYFSEAIEREGNAPLHKLMEDLGGLPVLGSASGGKWNQNAYSLEDLIVTSFQVTDSVPILHVHLDDVVLVGQEKYRLNVRLLI
jgi:hypothetical protein